MEKKKKRRQFDALFTCKFEWSSVAAQLPLPHTFLHYYCTHGFSSCLALIHSFSPATIHFLKRKNQDKKKKIDDIHPCLCSCLQFSASFFFCPLDGSIEWSIYADAFTAIHGWHQDALFSCTQPEHRRFAARHWNGKL